MKVDYGWNQRISALAEQIEFQIREIIANIIREVILFIVGGRKIRARG